MKLTVFIRKHKLYLILFIFDLMAFAASILASGTSFFADAYSHSLYRYGSLVISSVTGLLPFSLVELMLYFLLVFIPLDLIFQILSALKMHRSDTVKAAHIEAENEIMDKQAPSMSVPVAKKATHYFFAGLLRGSCMFLGHLFLIISLLFSLYVFNCGINYYRTPFSVEAGLDISPSDINETDLEKLCEYLVEGINESEAKLLSHSVFQASANPDSLSSDFASYNSPAPYSSSDTSRDYLSTASRPTPIKLYNGAYLGEAWDSEKPSLSYLLETGKNGQTAMEKLGAKFPRLSGHYPLPKPLINSWLLSIQQVTGVYSPFTIEANYNRDIPYYDIPFTICHELSHLRGYMQEEEANFIAILATTDSDDAYFNYSGFVSAWVYAGNTLAGTNPEKFAELYNRINVYTRLDMQYNNDFWDRYETEIAETHEKLNDAYLKYNGQTAGVLSYGHVVDLMVAYYRKNGTLH